MTIETLTAPPSDASRAAAPTGGERAAGARIVGYDLARALAILGMVLVHFTLVMSSDRTGGGDGWLSRCVGFLDGRAAATFVVLAGVGLTLRSRGAAAAHDDVGLARARATVRKRGVFLLVVGFLNLLIWPGDILRVYGVSLLAAAPLLAAPARRLWGAALAFVAGFLVLIGTVEYSKNWDWATMEYHRLRTPGGAVRNLFYDGFRSVFPWTGLLFFGMWLGTKDLRSRPTRLRFLLAGLGLVVVVGIVSQLLLRQALAHPAGWRMDAETARAVLGTESMPPMPLFLLTAVGTAVFVIAASVGVAEAFAGALWVRALVAAGQMAFTWYVGHIVLGLGAVIALGWAERRALWEGVSAGLAFFAVACVLSLLWRRRFRHGPLEWVMRRVCG
jgi:uncharacterized membrane protein YeiB